MSDNTPNQPSKFNYKKLVEMNDDSGGTYNKDNQIRFKTSMWRSSLSDYSDACILVKGTITVADTSDAAANNGDKKVIVKKCVLFTNCISRISHVQVDDAHDIALVMPVYSLIENSDNYSKTSWF